MLVPWIVFPGILALLCAGCGTVSCRIAGIEPSGALLLPIGYATLVVVAGIAVWIPDGAHFATAIVAGLAVTGCVLGAFEGRRPGGTARWALTAAAAVALVYGAAVILSGEPGFAGYISLDDSATMFALSDRALETGRSIDGLGPSSYEATLADYLVPGYPIGSLLPLGIGSRLTGQDVAWLFQPYLSFLAALVALSLFELAAPVVRLGWARALLASVAAQSALLYAYGLWGGVKELAAAALVPLCAAAAGRSTPACARATILPAIAVGALLGAVSLGGLVWLLGGGAIGLVWAVRRRLWCSLAMFAAATVASSLPALWAVGSFFDPSTRAILSAVSELGNLSSPLDPLQLSGVWPAGDFRRQPDARAATLALIGLVVALAAVGATVAWRRRAWPPLAYVSSALVGALILWVFGSPWVEAKAFATASPSVLFVAGLGCAAVAASGRRAVAGVAVALVTGGVIWSNVLAYGDVWLAPRDQLKELEQVGERFAGMGPALMTEYNPYGVRHFLRALDPEGVSELRRRPIPLLDGSLLDKGGFADLDELRLDGLLLYRTLVLRRSPVASRPPSAYHLVWSGGWYEVWQRPELTAPSILEHVGLGAVLDPAGTVSCSEVERLAAGARLLAAVSRPAPLVVLPLPPAGSAVPFAVPSSGDYAVWLGGSTRVGVSAAVDGRTVGSSPYHLNGNGQYLALGQLALSAGTHELVLSFAARGLRPGSRGTPFPAGPIVIVGTPAPREVDTYAPLAWSAICAAPVDWVEALR